MRLVAVSAPPWITDDADGGRVTRLADAVEIRLDLLPGPPDFDVTLWIIHCHTQDQFVTLRSRSEGGLFDGSAAEAAERLIGELDPVPGVDAEAEVLPMVLKGSSAKLERKRLGGYGGAYFLASMHGIRPIDLPHEGVLAWKIARPVTDGASMRAALEEARALAARFLEGKNPRAFVVPYGPLGRGLRVVTAAIAEGAGADPFVYGSIGHLPEGSPPPPALPDLPPLAELVDELRLGEVSGNARLFGLVGRPPSRSPSPRLHNSVFRALGLDAVYLPEVDLTAEAALALPYEGWSVTTPLKEAVAARCDELEPLAQRIGAVNTVVRDPAGRFVGSNTDAEAVAKVVRESKLAGGGALVFGGGGFARAAAVALADAGFFVRIAGRESASRAASDLRLPFAGPAPIPSAGDSVLVNATPLGADGVLQAPLAPLARGLRPGVLALDAPYGAEGRTGAFAEAARAAGAACADGFDLLLAQARGQARRFTGRDVDPLVLRAALDPRGNLILVGPRGAGKTSVGRLVARRLGRPFVDTDDEVARRAGRPAGRVLEEKGESVFRDLERREVERALARTGAVVSLGGGALLMLGAVELARARGFVVRLVASAGEMARRIESDPNPRPRLTDALDLRSECARLLEARESGYAAAAHASVATEGREIAEVANDVVGQWIRADFGRRA